MSLAGTAASAIQTGRVLSFARAAGGPLVLALDADQAGAAATRAWIDTLRHHSDTKTLARTLAARLPSGWDPADWLAHHGPAGLRAFDPKRAGQQFGPVPPGAEIVALTLAEHTRSSFTRALHATGWPPTTTTRERAIAPNANRPVPAPALP